jgi:hypothetical protein
MQLVAVLTVAYQYTVIFAPCWLLDVIVDQDYQTTMGWTEVQKLFAEFVSARNDTQRGPRSLALFASSQA